MKVVPFLYLTELRLDTKKELRNSGKDFYHQKKEKRKKLKVIINNRGEYYDVDSSFLERIDIIREEEIGDVVFITGKNDVYFSIGT